MANSESTNTFVGERRTAGDGPTLRETEARLAAALAIAKLGIFEWNILTGSVTCDERSREIFGFAGAEGWAINEVIARIHPDDLPRVQAESYLSSEDLTRLETEYRVMLPDGKIRYVTSITHPIARLDGKAERMFGVLSDITERKQAETALRQREEQLQRALEIDTVGVIIFDLEGNIAEANDAFLRMSGFGREDLDKGPLRWDVLTPPEWMPVTLDRKDQLAATGRARPYEKQYIRKDGSRWWGLFAPKMLNDREGVEFILDITERKQAEEALQESESRFRRAFSHAAVGLVLSGRGGRLLYVNPAYCDIVGYNVDELRDKDFFTLTHPDDVPRNRELHRQLLSGEIQNFVMEKRYIRKCGESVWVRTTATVMAEEAGRPTQFIAIVEDIQDRKEAEAALLRSREELGQFAHTVAHDLQTPLRGLLSYSQLLGRKYQGKLDAEADELLRFIVDSGRAMEQLIRALLRYAEVDEEESGRKPVRLADVIDGVRFMMQEEIVKSGAEITYSDLPTVEADPIHLTQLFQNLVGNAIKYRKADAAPRIKISAEPRRTACLFSVEDNGQGMDPKYSERIFQPLRRLHGKEVPGSGIGLAICKKIVDRYGGRIWVESEPGKGSTFRFTIPCRT
jgi:PAS domain S-box-containing protein